MDRPISPYSIQATQTLLALPVLEVRELSPPAG